MPAPIMPVPPETTPQGGMPAPMPSPGGYPQGAPSPAPGQNGTLDTSGTSPQAATPEQKKQLLDLIQQIRAKLAEMNANSFAGNNQSEQTRLDGLREVFSMMQAAGVDLADPQSVQAFITQLQKFNPDIAQMFENAMDSLLGGEQGAAPQPDALAAGLPPMPGSGNPNEAIPQNV